LRRRREKPDGNPSFDVHVSPSQGNQEVAMNAIIYLVGLVVIVLFILSFIGLR
jgi:preprotein translocase subunit SecD